MCDGGEGVCIDFISSCLSVQNKPTLRRTSSELYVDKGKHDL